MENEGVTLSEILKKIKEVAKEFPDLDVTVVRKGSIPDEELSEEQ